MNKARMRMILRMTTPIQSDKEARAVCRRIKYDPFIFDRIVGERIVKHAPNLTFFDRLIKKLND